MLCRIDQKARYSRCRRFVRAITCEIQDQTVDKTKHSRQRRAARRPTIIEEPPITENRPSAKPKQPIPIVRKPCHCPCVHGRNCPPSCRPRSICSG